MLNTERKNNKSKRLELNLKKGMDANTVGLHNMQYDKKYIPCNYFDRYFQLRYDSQLVKISSRNDNFCITIFIFTIKITMMCRFVTFFSFHQKRVASVIWILHLTILCFWLIAVRQLFPPRKLKMWSQILLSPEYWSCWSNAGSICLFVLSELVCIHPSLTITQTN